MLALADGTLWPGLAFGAIGERSGELVFNTCMTGYQEVLTDPSYHGQIPVMTQPHIGNTGANDEDDESERCWVAGFIVRSASPLASNWRANRTLDAYLRQREIVGMTDVDTRALVRHIRTRGAMNATLSSMNTEPERLVALARAAPDMNGLDLAREVTCAAPYEIGPDPRREPCTGCCMSSPTISASNATFCAFWRTTTAASRSSLRRPRRPMCSRSGPDGVFLSNGPGDPAAVTYAIEATRALLGRVPIFGICLGHQILVLALGGETYKLKFGHRGGNQPVRYEPTHAVAISSHNHGFAVRAESLPTGVTVTHINLNDGCVEGLAAPSLRAFSVQYHPEAAPGPHDALGLFDEFIALMLHAQTH